MEDEADRYTNILVAGVVLVAVTCAASLIPIARVVAWIAAAPLLLSAFVLGIVAMARGATGRGLCLALVSLLVAPPFIILAPVVMDSAVGEIVRVSAPTPSPIPTIAVARPTPTPIASVMVLRDVPIKIEFGETVIRAGTRLELIASSPTTARIMYLGRPYDIPRSDTDLR